MNDLIAWLRACLDEDEIGATAAGVVPEARDWAAGPDHVEDDERVRVAAFIDSDETPLTAERALHIARWDPARVLREVEAKRKILDAHQQVGSDDDYPYCSVCYQVDWETTIYGDWPCDTLKLLALPFDDRPGYRSEWRP